MVPEMLHLMVMIYFCGNEKHIRVRKIFQAAYSIFSGTLSDGSVLRVPYITFARPNEVRFIPVSRATSDVLQVGSQKHAREWLVYRLLFGNVAVETTRLRPHDTSHAVARDESEARTSTPKHKSAASSVENCMKTLSLR